MDPFAALFAHVTPRAQTFFTGKLCQTVQYPDVGHLHFLKDGAPAVRQQRPSARLARYDGLLFPLVCT